MTKGPSNQLPDREADKPYEEGLPLPEAPQGGTLPPGGGRFVLPHFLTFSELVNLQSRTYRYTFDEAVLHNATNSRALRRDPVIMDALRERQLAVAQLPWHIEVDNDQDQLQQEAQQTVTKILQRTPRFQQLLLHLEEAVYYGRYAVQPAFEWDFSYGRRALAVRDHRPVNGDKLVFKYSGEVGIRVHVTYDGSTQISDLGRVHILTPQEREHLIVHRWEPDDADFTEGQMSGSVHGVGIRGRLYWLWYLKQQVLAFLMDYLERVGAGGFTIYYYEHGNKQSLDDVKDAAENQFRNNAILFPRYRSGEKGGPGIERVEPSVAGAQLLQFLVSEYFDNIIRRYILGQNLTTESGSTGLGSGVADLHGETFSRRVKYDATAVQDTVTTDLVQVIAKYTYPELPRRALRFAFDIDKPNVKELLESANILYNMGASLDEAELRDVAGLAKPEAGHSILAKMGTLSPAAAGGVPAGVPMLGAPGPAAGAPPGQAGVPPTDPAGAAAGLPPSPVGVPGVM